MIMESYAQPTIFIPVLVGLIIVFLYYLLKRRTKGSAKSSHKEELEIVEGIITTPYYDADGNIPVRVFDNYLARWYDTLMSIDTADKMVGAYGSLGRQWQGDEKRYFINRFKNARGEEELRPIVAPTKIISGYDPTELYQALKQPAIKIITQEMLSDDDKNFIEKYGVVLWWIAVMGFLAFMWANA